MNNEIQYISYEESLMVYRKMIDASDGGFAGVRDEGGILATLDFIQNDMYCTILPLRKSSLIWSSSFAQGIISMMGTSA